MTAAVAHVLLVEDDEPYRHLLERALGRTSKLRVVVTSVGTRRAAEQVLALKPFDLVLLDLSLPDSHGVDSVIGVVRVAPDTPVIVLSGREDLDVAVVAIRAGASDYLVKRTVPDAEELERAMLYALLRAQAADRGRRLAHAVARTAAPPTNEATPPPPPAAAEPYLREIEATLGEILDHLRRNSPTQAEAVEAIFDRRQIPVVLRELRVMLRLDAGLRSSSPDLADVIGDDIPNSRAEAERTLIAYLEQADDGI